MTHGDRESQVAAVQRAIDLGINHFDTAPNYRQGPRDGVSEENLGTVLRVIGARPIVATKVEFWPDDFEDIPGKIERSIEGSLNRLGIDCVDILYLHNRVMNLRVPINTSAIASQLGLTDVLGSKGVLEAFGRLRAAGKIRFTGFCWGGDPAAQVQLLQSGGFDCVQVNYNLLNARADDRGSFIDLAGAHGVGVVAFGVLQRAALTDEHEPHPLSQTGGGQIPTSRDLDHARVLESIAYDHGQSLVELAIRFAMTKPAVSSVLVGYSTVSHVEQAAVCTQAGGLSPEELDSLEEWFRGAGAEKLPS